MKSSKINESDILSLKISSLPTRPTAPTAFGGKGYTATQMKEAFDRLPLYIIKKYNQLYDDICADPDESIASMMKSGIYEGHTLSDLLSDILSGEFASYMNIFGESLAECIGKMRVELDELKSAASALSEVSE